jgi:hypothetical protein
MGSFEISRTLKPQARSGGGLLLGVTGLSALGLFVTVLLVVAKIHNIHIGF